MSAFISGVQHFCWNPLTLCAFLGTGFYFSIKTNFFQLRHPLLIFRSTFGKTNKRQYRDGISPLAALSSSLAACMGTGNIIGVAAALSAGGPGAVFWMVVSAILGEMTCCAENILGIEYRVKNDQNEWLGGSMTYIENAFSSRKPACIFSVFCIASSLGMGNMTQSNAIASALCGETKTSSLAVGICLASITGLIILGGVKRITSITEKVIPFASAVFILALSAVIIKNYKNIPQSINMIFEGAFGLNPMLAGGTGYGISKTIRTGIARGVFSNEAGLGSSAIVHSAADVSDSVTQGMWGIAEVFIDTVLMCTLTALALLTSGALSSDIVFPPTQMNTAAFSTVMGDFSSKFVSASLCVFAFATIIGWAFYGEKAAEYALGKKAVAPYRVIYIICTVIGATTKLETVWALADIFNALMAIPNLAALIKLRKKAVQPITDCTARSKFRF